MLATIATALAALEIALKEAPARGWIAGPVVGLVVLSAVGLAGFIARTRKARHPIVDLGSLGSRNFVVGCVLSFVLGVGLFGSVWGIYHALVQIGLSGQGTLDKVAGPVGEALIMTAVGLAVAIPAVLAYNALTRRNRIWLAQLDNFAHDLYVLVTMGDKKA